MTADHFVNKSDGTETVIAIGPQDELDPEFSPDSPAIPAEQPQALPADQPQALPADHPQALPADQPQALPAYQLLTPPKTPPPYYWYWPEPYWPEPCPYQPSYKFYPCRADIPYNITDENAQMNFPASARLFLGNLPTHTFENPGRIIDLIKQRFSTIAECWVNIHWGREGRYGSLPTAFVQFENDHLAHTAQYEVKGNPLIIDGRRIRVQMAKRGQMWPMPPQPIPQPIPQPMAYPMPYPMPQPMPQLAYQAGYQPVFQPMFPPPYPPQYPFTYPLAW